MSAAIRSVNRATTVAFVLGLSVSFALTMCSDAGGGTRSNQASLDALEARIEALEDAENGTDVVYLKDVQASLADSGTCTSATWVQRTLNTLIDPFEVDWITGPNLNQFTLAPGTYEIISWCSAYTVNQFQCKVVDATNGTDVLFGGSGFSGGTGGDSSSSTIMGVISVSTTATFQVETVCGNSISSNDFGNPANSPSGQEEYLMLKIKRLSD